eukprot:1328097-Alexandrium_andersonii.AAC.1
MCIRDSSCQLCLEEAPPPPPLAPQMPEDARAMAERLLKAAGHCWELLEAAGNTWKRRLPSVVGPPGRRVVQ